MGNVSTTSQTVLYYNGGSQQETEGTVTLSSSYAAGGDAATARQFGLGVVTSIYFNPSTSGYALSAVGVRTGATSFTVAAFKQANIAITAGTTASVQTRHLGVNTGGTDIISSASANLVFAQAALTEATAATDLSAVTARFRARGY